jgi:sugar O-acyltransferase (sialic acid O-acetyltransferase NeuD family)
VVEAGLETFEPAIRVPPIAEREADEPRAAGEFMPVPKRPILYGAGYPDILKLIARVNAIQDEWDVVGFLDDSPGKQGMLFMKAPILSSRGLLDTLDKRDTWYFNNVYGTTSDRLSVARRLIDAGCEIATLVHPGVDQWYCEIGVGTIVGERVVLGANVRIGRHCAVRPNSVVNHDNFLEHGVFVGPGATFSGPVTVRTGAYIGAGSTIKERVEIGANSIVAVGAVVVRDVRPGSCVAGVPARELPMHVLRLEAGDSRPLVPGDGISQTISA